LFTPGTSLKVTAVRSYFGDNVSIWTAGGKLLASQNVVNAPGTWVDTPLPAPLLLSAGVSYMISARETGAEFFYSGSVPTTFPDVTISQSYYDNVNAFPMYVFGAGWVYVDMRYTTNVVSAPINPGTTANFSNGIWSGNIAVLQASTNVTLQASAGPGSAGTSNPFNVLGTPKLTVTGFSNSVLLSWPVPGFTLEQTHDLATGPWTAVPGVVSNYFMLSNSPTGPATFYRLHQP
jgi:hypothetical protein